MKTRCNNSNFKDYRLYKGKGITYDPRWEDFRNFYTDMGASPPGTLLDRIDSEKDYTKENCRWASATVSARNTSKPLGKSGIRGVNLHTNKFGFYPYWIARAGAEEGRKHLYHGQDFFEACCARKSWEAKRETP